MGCGDSKLAVATTNTLLRRKKANAADSVKKSKDVETNPKTATHCDKSIANSTQQQRQQVNNVDAVVAEEVKDINENKKENGDDKEVIARGGNKALVIPEREAGRFITSEDSPKLFYSSRKLDEEGIDALISEGRSGDYYTPRHGPGSKGNLFFKVDDQETKNVEEDKELLPAAAEETKPAEETTSPTEKKGEPAVLVEEKLVKETVEVETETATVEAKASSPAAEEEKKEDKS